MITTVGALFDIIYGQKEYHNKEWLEGTEGKNLLISSKGVDNGAYGFFDIQNKYKAPIITVQGYGTIGHAFVQEYNCSVDDHMLILIPKQKMSLEELYQVAYQIRLTKWKYRYGRGITKTRLEPLKIKIIKSRIDYNDFSKKIMPKEVKVMKIKRPRRIKLVKLTDLCDIKREYYPYLNEIDRTSEKYPYITTTEYDNGVAIFCNEEPIFKKGSLTVSLDGSCGITFYQFSNFIAGEKTAVLTIKDGNNPLLLMYIGMVIRLKSWKYHYGRKLSIGRLSEIQIPIPINDNGKYDLDYLTSIFMNSYGFKELEKAL